jgi:hypothetical protein
MRPSLRHAAILLGSHARAFLAEMIPFATLIVGLFLETNLSPLRHVQINLSQSTLLFPICAISHGGKRCLPLPSEHQMSMRH